MPWHDPVEAASAFAAEAFAGVLLSGEGGWSYVLRQPDRVFNLAAEACSDLSDLPARLLECDGPNDPTGPPFQGGLVGLASYELSARLEATAPQDRGGAWPDLTLVRYPAVLAFHQGRQLGLAIARGSDPSVARDLADRAAGWLQARPRPIRFGVLAVLPRLGSSDLVHAQAVTRTVARIEAGEIFQANLARSWTGELAPDVTPFDLFRRLAAQSPAPYGAYLRLPGRALVSNSPERFLSVRPTAAGLRARSDPIKGTRRRDPDPGRDRVLAAELIASAKDRAENLMIVDLMRNDLARVSRPGSVRVPALAELRTFANVHHLVSRVESLLAPGRTAWDAFLAAFPPGSVTGAPKLQAMKVIAEHEPPRGPYCGSLFWLGVDGALDASVLIRTVTCVERDGGWRFEARAGGGIVADSDPAAEVAETLAKISAILRALGEDR